MGGVNPPMSAAEQAQIAEYAVPVSESPQSLGPRPMAAAEQTDLSEYAVPISEETQTPKTPRPTNWSDAQQDNSRGDGGVAPPPLPGPG